MLHHEIRSTIHAVIFGLTIVALTLLLGLCIAKKAAAQEDAMDPTATIGTVVTWKGQGCELREIEGAWVMNPLSSTTQATQPDQTLSTTVQDPNYPDEPWIVTTHRRPDESARAFIKRHREMVEAVREALGEQ